MSHSRDNLLPANIWPMSDKNTDVTTVIETETLTKHEVCRVYVLPVKPKAKKKTKKGKRK